MQKTGYLLLADISGYTEFVTQTEIEHGSQILQSLIQILLDETKPPLRVQEVEGDAVFSYGLAEEFDHGELLLQMIEGMYAAFKTALGDIRTNSTCSCRACARAVDLSLKFVAHYGTFTPRAIAGHEGIAGPDVILVHRLLKNRIREQSGLAAYAFLTDAAVAAIDVPEFGTGMVRYGETYEHLGRVEGYAYDLAAYWDELTANRAVVVAPEGAFLATSTEVPVSRAVAWEYLTNPRYRRQWLLIDELTVEKRRDGRYRTGTVEHCVHGKGRSVIKTLDCKPIRYLTQSFSMPLGGWMTVTTTLEDAGEHTVVSTVFSQPGHENRLAQGLLRLMLRVIGSSLKRKFAKSDDAYLALLREPGARPSPEAQA
jgi:uncharacterized protein YndB with AHSA1/START domain